MTEWTKRTKPIYIAYMRLSPDVRDTWRLESEEWKKIFHVNRNQKNTGVLVQSLSYVQFFATP